MFHFYGYGIQSYSSNKFMRRAIMIFACCLTGLLMTPVGVTAGQAERSAGPEFRDAATHDALVDRFREAQANNPLGNYRTSENASDPSVENRPVDIIENSDIISFNGLTTLVPKRAILAVPSRVKNRVGAHVGGNRIVTWSEFHHANRSWITTIEVSRPQAEGRRPLTERTHERIRKSANLIVATYQGGPISVLPAKVPDDSDGGADDHVVEAAEQPENP